MSTQKLGSGKYEIVERLGRGGMAEVYRAYQNNLDRFVAIKLLHPFLADDPEFKSRFEKEARHIARLKHPNIVQVYDFEDDPERENYFMVMELIEGPTLKELLAMMTDQGKLLPINQAIRIVREAASALSYAHSLNMIHRDVKPANLMLDKDNRVVLTDFGIAKIVTGVQFTSSGGMVGTPAYMSPEQGLGEQGDERSDLYSLGVIFFQMLTGRLPYDGDTPLSVILKHLNDPVQSPRAARPDLPQSLDEIVTQLMAKEPTERFQTATELIADLDRFDREEDSGDFSIAGVRVDDGEYDTQALSKPPKGEPQRTPPAGVRPPPAITLADAQRALTNTGSFRRIPVAPPAPPPVPVAPPRRGVSIWLWLLLSVLLGVGVYAVVFGGGAEAILTALGRVTPTATVTETLAAVVVAPTETPSPSLTPTDAPTQTPVIISATPEATTNVPTQTAIIVSATPLPPTATHTPTLTRTPRPTNTPRPTSTPRPPTITPTATIDYTATQSQLEVIRAIQTATAQACQYDYLEVSRVLIVNGQTIADGSIEAGETFTITLTLRNTGNCAWDVNSSLRYREGEFFDSEQIIRLDRRVAPLDTYEITFSGRAPRANGQQTGLWDFRTSGDLRIGREPIPFSVTVFGA